MSTAHAPTSRSSERVGVPTDDRCPWCDQPVSHAEFIRIRRRIETEERERAAALERQLRAQLATERAAIEARAATAVADAQTAAAATATAARAEGAASAKKVAAAALAKVERERDAAQTTLKDAQAEQSKILARRLQEQRASLAKAASADLAAEKARAFAANQDLASQVETLKQKLERLQTGHEGEGATIDLPEALRETFPGDRIRKVGHDDQGANLLQEIVVDGRVSGRIVYDWRARGAWRNGYVTRLRKDQVAHEADHAILTTQHFPSGADQLDVRNRVIIINPARVVALVQVLREQVIQFDALRLSQEERADKASRILDFISSPKARRMLDDVQTAAEAVLELDVEEQATHRKVWRRRGELGRSIQKAEGSLISAVDRIIGGSPPKAED